MSKHALVGILVLCFVSTFMTMLYQYAGNGWKYETSPPMQMHGEGHAPASHAAPGGHATPAPGGAVAQPMAVETATPVTTPTP
jgi:hypothetical protein